MIKETIKTFFPEKFIHYAKVCHSNIKRVDPVQLRWLFNLKRIVSLNRLRKFKDKHIGEKCFIIGNGPSLNKMDLYPLRNEYTFGLNRIYLLFPKIGFHTTYLVSVNKLVIEQSADDFVNLRIPKFLSVSAINFIPFTNNIIFIKTDYGSHQFSFNPGKVLWESGTVTYIAIQLAYYMGFQKVILIGVDHNFVIKGTPNTAVISNGDDPDHFDPNYFGKGFKWQLPDLELSEVGYKLARKVYNEDNREIFDATIDGKLNIFPKITYEEALKILP